jgi:hypothetical protein
MKKAPTAEMGNRVMDAVRKFEEQTGKTVKSIRLVRLDKPVVFNGSSTDLVDVEVTIRS